MPTRNHNDAPESFLATLGMRFTIADVEEDDLLSVAELALRSNQLDATGTSYDVEKLRGFMCSPWHSLLVCELADRTGAHGKIGAALVEHMPDYDHIRALVMCGQIGSRGAASVMVAHLMLQARQARRWLRADFRHTGCNGQMLEIYQLAGFRETRRGDDGVLLFQHDLDEIQDLPPYIEVCTRSAGALPRAASVPAVPAFPALHPSWS